MTDYRGRSQSGSLSIVPYDTNREVVLRHANSVVVYDTDSRQLILRSRDKNLDARANSTSSCPTCGRPYVNEAAHTLSHDASTEEQPSFINAQYFRMLAQSLPGSEHSSRPSSPRRRIADSAEPNLLARDEIVPPEAEFIGSSPALPDETHNISENAFTHHYFEKFFTIVKELGRGGRGVVLLVKHVLDGVDLGQFACKRVPVGDDHEWLAKVLVEVQALQQLSHQNLVSYRHVWLEDYQISTFGPSVPCAFILQQFCNGGDLHSYVCAPAQAKTTTKELKERIRRRSKGEQEIPELSKEPRKVPFDEIYSFFRDITDGLRFLHREGFIHRDLKPSNCLLHYHNDNVRVLVSDFGEVQYENAIRKSTGATGTISYCAPEVLRPVSPGGPLGNFTFKSDIFSLGMILHFLCFAALPYSSADVLNEEKENVDELRAEIISWLGFDERRKKRPDLPSELYAFLKRLLSLEADQRPTAEEVFNGIQRGGGEVVPELRRRNSEDVVPGRRVQKLDTPAPRASSKRGQNSDTIAISYPARRQVPPLPRASHQYIEDSDEDALIEDDAPESATMRRRASSRGEATAVVLRPKASVATPLPSPELRTPSLQEVEKIRPLLLEPPPQNLTPLRLMKEALCLRIQNKSFYLAIFALKVVSVLQPCIDQGTNPTVVYLLLGLASVESSLSPSPLWLTIVLSAAHSLIVWLFYTRGMLCSPRWAELDS